MFIVKLAPALAEFLERRPHYGMLASATGFATALTSYLKIASPMLGLLGALFGLIAGYYTMRIKHAEWKKIQNEK